MPEMSAILRAATTSPVYRLFARTLVLPWALQGVAPRGDALEIGTGSGAMAAALLAAHPSLRMTVDRRLSR